MADEDKVQFQNLKNKQTEKPRKNIVQTMSIEKKKEDKSEGKEKKEDKKISEKKDSKPKKTEAVVYGKGIAISKKHSVAIGKFIKNKKISEAVSILEKVAKKKIAVPMKGEIPHRKGKIMSGRYPANASKEIIKLLKTLEANCSVNGLDLEKTFIAEIVLNKGPRLLHRFGRTEHKNIHILIKAKEKI